MRIGFELPPEFAQFLVQGVQAAQSAERIRAHLAECDECHLAITLDGPKWTPCERGRVMAKEAGLKL